MACCCWQVLSRVRLCNLMDCSQPGSSVHTSVQFSHSVLSDSLRPHELQHARPPCPSPTPGVYPNSCPLSRWCHPNISSSVVPSPPAFNLSQHQGLFQSQLFTSELCMTELSCLEQFFKNRMGMQASVVVAHGHSCSTACGIFLDQALNPCISPALAEFLTTGPPGKSLSYSLNAANTILSTNV